MKTVRTQIGQSSNADFEDLTWTFKMDDKFEVYAGEFAIVDKLVYDEILEVLSDSPILSKYNKAEDFIDAYEKWRYDKKMPAMKKLTETK